MNGFKHSNHLGNVLVTVSDKRTAVCTVSETVAYYKAEVITSSDYYSFGSIMENRYYEADSFGYRFSLNGQEKDDEIYGKGNTTTAEFWEYDGRLGRRWNIDPVPQVKFSDYSVFGNNPIYYVDIYGNTKRRAKEGSNKQENNNTVPSVSQVAGVAAVAGISLTATAKNNVTNIDAMLSEEKLNGKTISTGESGYVSDSKDAENLNLWVNAGLAFVVDESNANKFENYELFVVSTLVNNFVTGSGPENYVFPTNGKMSSKFVNSFIVNKALAEYKKNPSQIYDKEVTFGLEGLSNDLSKTGTPFSITGTVGSANIRIVPNEKGVSIEIFNVMSLSSGSIGKEIAPKFLHPESYVRPNEGSDGKLFYNISLTFNITLTYDQIKK